jgi:2-polyprenyl-3-methyl-5-hydroxy-6-metoxy-1,4-benzoquinol methylase
MSAAGSMSGDDGLRAVFVERSRCIACGSPRLVDLVSRPFDAGLTAQFIAADPWGESPAPFLRGVSWTLSRCAECSMVFHRHILDDTWNERRFSHWMTEEAIRSFESRFTTPLTAYWEATRNATHALRLEYLTRAQRGEDRLRVLDFGCGYGAFVAMCNLFGFQACGVDRSAAKRDNNHSSAIFARIEDITHLAPFHVLTLFQVLEHLDQPRELLQLLSGLLAPGGILVLETPDCTGVEDIRSREDFDRIHPLDHLNAFTPATLQSFAERLGFERIAKPPAVVAAGAEPLARSTAKAVAEPLRRATTEFYFRKR